jgi:hypothetical protein
MLHGRELVLNSPMSGKLGHEVGELRPNSVGLVRRHAMLLRKTLIRAFCECWPFSRVHQLCAYLACHPHTRRLAEYGNAIEREIFARIASNRRHTAAEIA